MLVVVAGILVLWYLAAIVMNASFARDQAERDGVALSPRALVAATWSQERPRLPAPHQVTAEFWKSTAGCRRPRSGASSTTPG